MGFSLKKAIGGAVSGFASSGGNPWGAVAGAGLGGFFGDDDKNSAYSTWKKQFAQQTAWEKEKMQNAHRWEMADLQAAGLNPALTAGSGSGASAGAPNPGQVPNYKNDERNSALAYIQAGQAAQKTEQEIRNLKAEEVGKSLDNDLIRKYGDTEKKRALANSLLQGQYIQANTALAGQHAAQSAAETIATEEQTKPILRENKFHENHPVQSGAITGIGAWLPIAKTVGAGAVGALSAKKVGTLAKAIEKAKVFNTNGFTGTIGKIMKNARYR